jgi:hypothetical protein
MGCLDLRTTPASASLKLGYRLNSQASCKNLIAPSRKNPNSWTP